MSDTLYQWTCNNKVIMLLGLLCVCLLISTITVSAKLKNAENGLLALNIPPERSQSTANKGHRNNEDPTFYRLPRHVVPNNYKLLLKPNMLLKTFNGTVEIGTQVSEQTSVIALHSHKLNITSVNLKAQDVGIEKVDIESYNTTKDNRQLLNIYLKTHIPKGIYKLIIEFSGRLDREIVGLYSSSLKNSRTMVASKFQPTYARQAFPCFDEPDFKATYDITLVKPQSYVALSNMNEISKTQDEENKLELVTFATSVPMSTYLACFVVCDFDFKETEINANGIGKNFTLRSFAQRDQMHKIDFAQDIGKRATEFYIKYYEVPFPLPKLDMIAIPDYVSGATEHWGLITYRETSFLVDESTASSNNKISVANTIAHELAHMWFGNLVTMKWWDEVWLNEGFASYMQVKALNAIEPSWTMLDQFLIKTLHSVLVTDAKLSSHPIVQTVNTPDQITAIFDAISYHKGASVLRMLEGFIGDEKFRLGVSDYLKKYEFGNTVTQDLLSCLEPYFKKDNPNLNITNIMDTWTRQMGYPVLTVSDGEDPNTYVIKQSRFLLDPEAVYKNDSDYNYRWFIPITYKTNKGANHGIVWFANTEDYVTLKLRSDEDWVKINNNQVGYYRVNYTDAMWQKLVNLLQSKSSQLTISDRAHLLNDAFALAEASAVSYGLALNLTSYLVVEDDYVPWATASHIFSALRSRLLNTLAYEHLQKYIQNLVRPLYEKQTWETTQLGVIERLLRTTVLSEATKCQLPEAEAKVRDLFLKWLNNHGTASAIEIETDLRNMIYYEGMKSASHLEWDKLWEILLKEEDVQEQAKLRHALSAPRDITILRKYLILAWDEKNIRGQDYLGVLHFISSNPSGEMLVWDEVRSNWPQLVDRFTLNSRYLGGLVTGITSSFNTKLKLDEMEAWFAKYPEAGAGATARLRALETVRNNIKWVSIHQPTVAAWLQTQQ